MEDESIPKNIEEFEHTFYINLEHRTDRKEHVEKELYNLGIKNTQRFNAIKMANGAIGCTMSHIKVLQDAKKNGLPYIMICEDDIQFTNPELFKKQLNGLLSSDESWDVILIAGNNLPPYTRINEFCVKVNQCQTTTGYIVKASYYDAIIENMREGIKKLMNEPNRHFLYAVDKYWFSLQQKDKWLLVTPLTVVQRVDYSDIERKMTNYRKAMTDLDKFYMMRMMENAKPL
uniref:Glycosyl transferase family 25 domain-containing protein n=1 Tax=viral metagenome TaxID=1070528 RepID=A0A6C0KYJ8_9ZZZZ